MTDMNVSNESIQPLYFIYKNGFLKDFDVCQAILDVIDDHDLMGVQRVGNLWRIYVLSLPARANLASTGVDIYGKHINLNTVNPYELRNKQEEKPIKITIQDVKMHITNEYIESYLRGLGVKLTNTLSFEKIKDDKNENTPFTNGNRIAFGDAKYLRDHPLPSYMLIGNCVARIRHFGQHPKASVCTKCFGDDHPVWKCNKSRACRVCKQTSHHEGTEMCPYYSNDNFCKTFGGKNDALSNFHPCAFTYRTIKYSSREQAYQHQKALFFKDTKVAEEILKMSDPGNIKRLSKCLVVNDTWKAHEEKCMYDICYNAALQNERYRSALLAVGDAFLVESVYGEYVWGSGLDAYCTARTQIDKLPGENKLGYILMNLRQRLQDIIDKVSCNNDEDISGLDVEQNIRIEHNQCAGLKPTIRNITNGVEEQVSKQTKNTVDVKQYTFEYESENVNDEKNPGTPGDDGEQSKCDKNETSDIEKKKRPRENTSPDTYPNKLICNGPTPPSIKSKNKTHTESSYHADFQDKSLW